MAERDHTHSEHEHQHDEHEHAHDHEEHNDHGHGGHGHTHGTVNPDLYGDRAGLRAVQISTLGMLLVSIIQFIIATIGNSAGLYADAWHNTGDVLTTIALWIAFALSRRVANQRYT